MTTPIDISAIRRLCEAAVPGPWTNDGGMVHDAHGMWVADVDLDPGSAALIAASRTIIPQLIDELERTRAERDAWRLAHDQLANEHALRHRELVHAQNRTAEAIAYYVEGSGAPWAAEIAGDIRSGAWRKNEGSGE